MLARFVTSLFGCRHRNYSFPMTLKPNRRRANPSHSGPYVVCFDCSRELPYDWANMRVTATRRRPESSAIARANTERAAA
jgi:hypothetical protein